MSLDLSTTITTIRAIAGVAREAGKLELYQQVLDLQQTVLEAVTENTELARSNAELSREVNALRSDLDALRRLRDEQRAFVFKHDAYWKESSESDEGPFCPKCLDVDGRVVRMTDRKNGFTCCVNCKYCMSTPGYQKPVRTPRESHGLGWVHDY